MNAQTSCVAAERAVHFCKDCAEFVQLADDGRCYGCDAILDVEAYRHWFWSDAPEPAPRVTICDFTKGVA